MRPPRCLLHTLRCRAKQQKFIKTVTHQVKHEQFAAAEGDKKKKIDKKKKLEEMNELFFQVVIENKNLFLTDLPSYITVKNKRPVRPACKFSHDLTLERKCEKRSLCVDGRDEDLEKDTMDNWDEKKLEEVVHKKLGEAELKKAKTQQTPIYFLDDIESNEYGWFRVCPGGGDNCMYRRALPAGFVLRKVKTKEDSLEELIENERSALGPNVTRITLETFLTLEDEQDMKRKRADLSAGRSLGVSGREVFEFLPDLVDDDDAETDDTKGDDDGDEAEDFLNIDVGLFLKDAGITVASADRVVARPRPTKDTDGDAQLVVEENGVNGEGDTEDVPVDENLFTGDYLGEVEEELDTLDLDQQDKG
uniref:Zinc finger CCCH-type containing 15 n=1 Tax=Oncorhynchus mykiss TaxID=8022 RepID=A0A8K9UAJ3_ONCMY